MTTHPRRSRAAPHSFAPSRSLVVGLGTGRCGTTTLSGILDNQHGGSVTHERRWRSIRWDGSERQVCRLLDRCTRELVQGAHLAGDVAMYYLPYADLILRRYGEARLVCLRRDRASTVASFLAKVPGRNPWAHHDGSVFAPRAFDRCFPKYGISDTKAAAGHYWDCYYAAAERIAATWPERFRVFEMDALNSEVGQRAILDFVGIPAADQVVQPGRRLNQRTAIERRGHPVARALRRARDVFRPVHKG